MKQKLVIVSVIVAVILAIIGALILLRGDEDSWICENGAWVKHGNPEATMPETPCPGAVEKKIEELESVPSDQKNGENSELFGGQRDEHGCLGPAGYTWCEEKQKCLRTWEEECAVENKSDAPLPDPAPQPLPPPNSSDPAPSPLPSSDSLPSIIPSDTPTPLPLP